MARSSKYDVRTWGANKLIMMGLISESYYGRYQRRDFSKVTQTPEEKQAALAKAEAKRRRKGQKRYHDYVNCLFNSAIVKHSCRLHHWQTSVVTASPA